MQPYNTRMVTSHGKDIKSKRSIRIIFITAILLSCVVIYLISSTIKKDSFNDKNSINYDKSFTHKINDQIDLNNDYNEEQQLYNIIMIETNDKADNMNLRQLCSIESAAYHNPTATIHVNSIKAKINLPNLLKKHKNIKWSSINLTSIFENTPLNDWWLKGKLNTDDDYFKYSHLSDALRLLLVYKYGGFYSDLDHIAIKNYQPLLKFSALINNNVNKIDTESSFFHMKKEHEFLLQAMQEFSNNYDRSDWGANGPKLLKRTIIKYCKTQSLKDLLITDSNQPGLIISKNINSQKHLLKKSNQNKFCDIGILPFYIAYPYPWYEAKKMLEHNANIEISRFINTFTIHFNTKVTSQCKLEVYKNSIIEFFMSINCPIVYQEMKNFANANTLN